MTKRKFLALSKIAVAVVGLTAIIWIGVYNWRLAVAIYVLLLANNMQLALNRMG